MDICLPDGRERHGVRPDAAGKRLRGKHHLPIFVSRTYCGGFSGGCHTVSSETCITGAAFCGGREIESVSQNAQKNGDRGTAFLVR